MTETLAIARLPNMDIEVAHRELPDDGAEQIAVRVTARPSFDALMPGAPAVPAMMALGPALFWFGLWRQATEPWLRLASPYGPYTSRRRTNGRA